MMLIPFILPPPKDSSTSPVWDGSNFVLGATRTPVLEYSENFEGWSDDLTALHEEAAGSQHPIDIASRSNAISQVKKFIPSSGGVILEIGCSSGFLIKDLRNSFPEAVVLGADVTRDPLYQLAKTYPGIPLLRFDLLQCPLPSQSVDVIIMLNVLEHIKDDVGALSQAYRLLKPGGVLIIEVPAGSYLYDKYDSALNHFRRYSAGDLRRKLDLVGFRNSVMTHLGFIAFPAFAAVKLARRWSGTEGREDIVRSRIASTSDSRLLRTALNFEAKYLAKLRLPFGIRVLSVSHKN